MGVLKDKNGINYRRITSLILFLILFLLGNQAVKYKKERSFEKLTIKIHKIEGSQSLLNKAQVLKMMREHLGFDPAVSSMEDVKLRALEESLEKNLFIKDAIIYIDSRNKLTVEIIQRKPIARVKAGRIDYYMAADGKKIPTSNYKTMRVPLISGYVGSLTSKTSEGRKNYKEVLELALKIESNEFLNALIEQIEIEKDQSIVMIPKIGSERIVLGNTDDLDEKLYKLEKYYEWGKNQDGWDKYAYLNLEYKDQVTLGK